MLASIGSTHTAQTSDKLCTNCVLVRRTGQISTNFLSFLLQSVLIVPVVIAFLLVAQQHRKASLFKKSFPLCPCPHPRQILTNFQKGKELIWILSWMNLRAHTRITNIIILYIYLL